MSDIKKGLWQKTGTNKYIKVRGFDEKGLVVCSDEGSPHRYTLSKIELLEGYELRYLDKENGDAGTTKTLARHGSLGEYVDSLPAYEQQPVIDDTFNDDTPAQTFSVLENMAKIICLKCGLDYQLCHNRLSIERDGMCRQCFDKANAETEVGSEWMRNNTEFEITKVFVAASGKTYFEVSPMVINCNTFSKDYFLENFKPINRVKGEVSE